MKLIIEQWRQYLKEQETIAVGQCYPFAVEMSNNSSESEFADLSKFKVVHGRVTDKFSGESVLHAWVEKGDTVFDAQTSHTKPNGIPKADYYDIYQPEPHEEYTAEETILKCMKTGHKGPWNHINEEEWRASGEEMMFPAKYLFSHMGEYRTERRWRDFASLPQEEKVKWAEGVSLEEPIEVTVFADGTFGHGDGHHRAMAGKILDVDVPIIISRNKLKQKSDDIWSAWISRVREGNSPKELNPEGYNINSLEQIQ